MTQSHVDTHVVTPCSYALKLRLSYALVTRVGYALVTHVITHWLRIGYALVTHMDTHMDTFHACHAGATKASIDTP